MWTHEVYQRRHPWIAILLDFSSHLLFIEILFLFSPFYGKLSRTSLSEFQLQQKVMSVSYIFIVQWFSNLLVGREWDKAKSLLPAKMRIQCIIAGKDTQSLFQLKLMLRCLAWRRIIAMQWLWLWIIFTLISFEKWKITKSDSLLNFSCSCSTQSLQTSRPLKKIFLFAKKS